MAHNADDFSFADINENQTHDAFSLSQTICTNQNFNEDFFAAKQRYSSIGLDSTEALLGTISIFDDTGKDKQLFNTHRIAPISKIAGRREEISDRNSLRDSQNSRFSPKGRRAQTDRTGDDRLHRQNEESRITIPRQTQRSATKISD